MDTNAQVLKTTGDENHQLKPAQNKFSRQSAVDLNFDTSKGDDMLIRAKMRSDQKRKEGVVVKDSPPYFK